MLILTCPCCGVMADETDGRAILNSNDLGRGLAQMMRDASAYYLLGYSSSAAPTDGRFHQIRVRVKRPGIEVRARRGYWALKPDEAATAMAPDAPGCCPMSMNNILAAAIANNSYSATKTKRRQGPCRPVGVKGAVIQTKRKAPPRTAPAKDRGLRGCRVRRTKRSGV